MTYDDGDLDGNGTVDILDWAIFQPNYGRALDPLPETLAPTAPAGAEPLIVQTTEFSSVVLPPLSVCWPVEVLSR